MQTMSYELLVACAISVLENKRERMFGTCYGCMGRYSSAG